MAVAPTSPPATDAAHAAQGSDFPLDSPPFYDPERSYEANYAEGPFGHFAPAASTRREAARARDRQHAVAPQHSFCGVRLHAPFGIPAGPLLNGEYVRAALDFGFDLPVYKTVRTRAYAAHAWPNVLAVHPAGELQPGARLTADHHYTAPVSITNSFGVPSMSPDVWQPDLAAAVAYARPGQCVIGSFQGTLPERNAAAAAYIDDFRLGARLLRETGVRLVEVNLSCPNEGTAHLLCYDTDRSQRVCEAIRDELGDGVPLLVKLAYFADDAALRALVEALAPSVAGYATINTISAEIVDAHGEQALPGAGRLASGVCGAAIRSASLSMVERLATLRAERGYSFAIAGTGGVTCPADAQRLRAAGADVVMSATGAMWNAHLAEQVAQQVATA